MASSEDYVTKLILSEIKKRRKQKYDKGLFH